MNIDWFTVLAQALNFLVLMWLLKRFLLQADFKRHCGAGKTHRGSACRCGEKRSRR
ncbi:MAG: hypothetical protein H6855_01645 [Rhodospirillales bacterium]|nr:hypothetical protein [Rhodospirillales bacterium]